MKNSHPKIGIRPIIDGRRGGIRESLEEMTMGMAQSVAKLYAAKLRYADGAPVECVIADTTIGGVAEAAAATDKFRDNNVGAVLSVTPCWCYGSETIDMDPLMPKAIWGFNKTQRPGAVYLASALAGHNQKGLPAFGIYGSEVQEQDDNSITPDVEEKLLRFGRRHGNARQILPLDRFGVDGHCRFDARSRFFPGVSGHAQRSRRLLGDRAPHRTGHL